MLEISRFVSEEFFDTRGSVEDLDKEEGRMRAKEGRSEVSSKREGREEL